MTNDLSTTQSYDQLLQTIGRRCKAATRKLYFSFPNSGTLSHKSSWSHYYEILKSDEPEQVNSEVTDQVGTKQGLSSEQVTLQVTLQVEELLLACVGELSRSQLMKEVKLTDRVNAGG